MSLIDSRPGLIRGIRQRQPSEETPTISKGSQFDLEKAWDDVLRKVGSIFWDSSAFDDEGFVPPTGQAYKVAVGVARAMLRDEQVPPSRVVPTGDGGFTFELEGGDSAFHIVINDSQVEYLQFEHNRLVRRHVQNVPD